MLGSCFVSFHFLGAILCPQAVVLSVLTTKTRGHVHITTFLLGETSLELESENRFASQSFPSLPSYLGRVLCASRGEPQYFPVRIPPPDDDAPDSPPSSFLPRALTTVAPRGYVVRWKRCYYPLPLHSPPPPLAAECGFSPTRKK